MFFDPPDLEKINVAWYCNKNEAKPWYFVLRAWWKGMNHIAA